MSADQTQENTATDVEDDALLQEQADGKVGSSGKTGVTNADASETTATATSTDSPSKADAQSEGSGGSSGTAESSYTAARAFANDASNELAARQQQSTVTPQKTTTSLYNRGRGVGSAIRNPTMKITPAGGTSTLGRRQSWADAAREDEMMGRNPYVNFMDASDLGDLENQDDLMDRLLYNNRDAEGTSATGATEEERKARRERIRARQEEKVVDNTAAGDDPASTPRYYRAADGSIKKSPSFVREEYLESMKEGGVPIKSWLAIFAVVGVGVYRIYKTVKGPAAGQKRRKNAAAALPPLKKRSGSKLKGKKGSGGKRINSTSTQSPRSRPPDLDPVIDFYSEEPEPKLEPKQRKKKTAAARKKRPKKCDLAAKHIGTAEPLSDVASPDNDEGKEGEKEGAGASSTVPAAAATATATATAATAATDTATDTATTDTPTGTVTVTTVPSSNVVLPAKSTPATGVASDLQNLNEVDRLAIMQLLAENGEDVNGDDGEWQTAGRKSKPVKKPKEQRKALATSTTNSHPNIDGAKEEKIDAASSAGNTDTDTECSATTDAGTDDPEKAAKDNSKEEKTDAGGEKKKGETKAAAPQSNAEESKPTNAESAADKKNEVAAAQRLKTKEEDAALALKLQQQEESMAAREKGETIDEMWEEVPKRKNRKKKAAATALTPSTAIAAS